jgi:1-deoxy-D-xylulose-5-phosphate synthase
VITKKGQGYKLAEVDPILYHGVSKFQPEVGIAGRPSGASPPTRRFLATGCATWRRPTRNWSASPRRCAKAPACCASAERYPDRYYDVGIAEQHAVTFAAGLACEGLRPVLAIYSTFLQRGYDQLMHDVALQNLPVVFALDRGGLVGADGPPTMALSTSPS